MGSKRAASPTPGPSVKRRRGKPVLSATTQQPLGETSGDD